MLESLENSALALWVSESLWAYPGLLSVHIIGLAIVVGLFAMRDLRLLGLFYQIDIQAFLFLNRIAALGFVVNAISGFLLFSSQATIFIQSTPFIVKITAVLVGMLIAVIIHLQLSFANLIKVTNGTKILALISLISWIMAIAAGRLIAYL